MSTEHPSSSDNDMCESERRSTDRTRFDRSCAHVLSCSWCGRRVCRAARMRCDLPSPCVHAPTHLCERRVCGAARMRCDPPSPCAHTHIHVSIHGGSSAGTLTHGCPDRTGRGASPGGPGEGTSRVRTSKRPWVWATASRVRLSILNSHSPWPGGTVPLPQAILAPQFASPLYSPAGAVTHGRAVGEVC